MLSISAALEGQQLRQQKIQISNAKDPPQGTRVASTEHYVAIVPLLVVVAMVPAGYVLMATGYAVH